MRLARILKEEGLRTAKWEGVGKIQTAKGSVPVVFDPETTTRQSAMKGLRLLNSIPKTELLKSIARRIIVYDNPEDVGERLEQDGIEIEDRTNGAFDFRSGTLYACLWDGYQESPRTLLHEFGHSIVGPDEGAAESWYRAFHNVASW